LQLIAALFLADQLPTQLERSGGPARNAFRSKQIAELTLKFNDPVVFEFVDPRQDSFPTVNRESP
jgi:hypothetical protein